MDNRTTSSKVFESEAQAAVVKDKMDEAYIGTLMDELQQLYSKGEIKGMFVIVQLPDGRHYPHFVGGCDAVRMLGISQTYLLRESDRQFSYWTSRACDRRVLEEGF